MSEDEFTKLFKYMFERFDRVDKTLERKANGADVQRMLGLLNALAKRLEISDDEGFKIIASAPSQFPIAAKL